jgi:hypothetical protein
MASESETGEPIPDDISENKYEYLAEAYERLHQAG